MVTNFIFRYPVLPPNTTSPRSVEPLSELISFPDVMGYNPLQIIRLTYFVPVYVRPSWIYFTIASENSTPFETMRRKLFHLDSHVCSSEHNRYKRHFTFPRMDTSRYHYRSVFFASLILICAKISKLLSWIFTPVQQFRSYDFYHL
jgi:hypothetical protein